MAHLATLGQDLVDVFSIHTEGPPAEVERLQALLSADENNRARQFAFNHLRHSFIFTRAALRILLGSYLQVRPERIQFEYGPRGKPTLLGPKRLHFSVSHSGKFALIGLILDCNIGVDIEEIRHLRDLDEIASRYFSQQEFRELKELSPADRQHSFFLCWTRKEAYIKATGDGLSLPLDSFRVSLRPDDPAAILHVAHDTHAARSWTLHNVNPIDGYAGAVAYRGETHILRMYGPLKPVDLKYPCSPGFRVMQAQ
jgi:4'-phosphopantetheinyl transferase